MSLLKKGDTVGFIAPSSFVKKEDISEAVKYFKEMGLKVKLAENLTDEYRYMAGNDKKRASSVNKMYADKNIKAIFCVRGGAGSSRILPYLDYNLIKSIARHEIKINLEDPNYHFEDLQKTKKEQVLDTIKGETQFTQILKDTI